MGILQRRFVLARLPDFCAGFTLSTVRHSPVSDVVAGVLSLKAGGGHLCDIARCTRPCTCFSPKQKNPNILCNTHKRAVCAWGFWGWSLTYCIEHSLTCAGILLQGGLAHQRSDRLTPGGEGGRQRAATGNSSSCNRM